MSAFFCCWLLAAGPSHAAIVALDDTPAAQAAVESLTRQWQANGRAVASQETLTQELTGSPEPKDPDEHAVRRMLTEARDREARFDTSGANDLRQQILRAFDHAVRPSSQMRALAGEAGLDMVAALLAEGQLETAEATAREIWARFPSTPIDETRHPPDAVQWLAARRDAVASDRRFPLTVLSSRAGVLFADGTRIGDTTGQLSTQLPRGSYRIWLEWEGGVSLPHAVELGPDAATEKAQPVTVTIDADLESRIGFGTTTTVKCAQKCAAVLGALGTRLGADRIVGVGTPETREEHFRVVEVDVETGDARELDIPADLHALVRALDREPEAPMATFRPTYLIPFGGGQLAQDRPLFAAGYLGIQLGLLGWYLWLRREESAAGDIGDLLREQELRARQDLALGFLVTAVVAGVIEAVVVGVVWGE